MSEIDKAFIKWLESPTGAPVKTRIEGMEQKEAYGEWLTVKLAFAAGWSASFRELLEDARRSDDQAGAEAAGG